MLKLFNTKENSKEQRDLELALTELFQRIHEKAPATTMLRTGLLSYLRAVKNKADFPKINKERVFKQLNNFLGTQPELYAKLVVLENEVTLQPLLSKHFLNQLSEGHEHKATSPVTLKAGALTRQETLAQKEIEKFIHKMIEMTAQLQESKKSADAISKLEVDRSRLIIKVLMLINTTHLTNFDFLRRFHLEAISSEKKSLAMLAIDNAYTHTLKVLLDCQIADINQLDSFNNTLLMLAIEKGRVECAKLLLARGANIMQLTSEGKSALSVTTQKWVGSGILEMLIKANLPLDLNLKHKHDRTMLMLCAMRDQQSKVYMLISRGVDLNIRDVNGNTALILALSHDAFTCAELLINAHCEVDHINNKGKSALSLAIEKKNLVIVKLLLEKGVKVDDPEKLNAFLDKHTKKPENADVTVPPYSPKR